MPALHISEHEFAQILRVSERALIHEATAPDDLQTFLVARLCRHHPDLATRLAHSDDHQLAELRDDVARALRQRVGSSLW